LIPHFSSNLEVRNRQVLAIACALRENKGLVDLDLSCLSFGLSGETWGAICDSLKAHPTLEVLNLNAARWGATTPVFLKFWVQALVAMLKVNMSIHTMDLDTRYCQHELYRGSVIPYLETNRLRPRLLAIQRTRPIPYRAKVLGRALLAVRTDPNRFWMLLSGNAEVAFPSGTSIAAAATAAASTSTAKVAAVAAFVMMSAALTTTVTDSLPTATAHVTAATSDATSSAASDALAFAPTVVAAAAANVATPSADHKRKSHP
jgi:hypothetical protein